MTRKVRWLGVRKETRMRNCIFVRLKRNTDICNLGLYQWGSLTILDVFSVQK